MAKGGGWESVDQYVNCAFDFLNIENIHVVREDLARMRGLFFLLPPPSSSSLRLSQDDEGCSDVQTSQSPPSAQPVARYLPLLTQLRGGQACKWFRHLSSILSGAHRVAATLEGGCSVLVHCRSVSAASASSVYISGSQCYVPPCVSPCVLAAGVSCGPPVCPPVCSLPVCHVPPSVCSLPVSLVQWAVYLAAGSLCSVCLSVSLAD